MQLVDAHCHLESEELADSLDGVLADARQAGIAKLVTAAVTPDEWARSLALAEQYPDVECALGVHPWYVTQESMARLDDLPGVARRGVKAIGEIGLDSKIQDPPLDFQIPFLERQLVVAKELNLPVVIHCRGAFNEMLAVLRRFGMPKAGGIIHSFGGNVELAEAFMQHGLSFSLGGTLTYRNSNKRKNLLKRIYPDHVLLETDSPDIPPVERHGCGPNVPANILYNLRAASEILGVAEEAIAEHTTANAVRLFRLEL